MTRPAPAPRASHSEIAERARANPGVWVLVRPYRAGYQAKSVASQIRSASPCMEAYTPRGAFEAKTKDTADATELLVRYVGVPTARVAASTAKLRSLLAGGTTNAPEEGCSMSTKTWDDLSKPDVELPDLLGSVRRHPDGTALAALWPSPPHAARWMVTDEWGSLGYERNRAVANWPIVGAVPYSPAAGMSLTPTRSLHAADGVAS